MNMNAGSTQVNSNSTHVTNLRQAIQNLDVLPAMPVIAQKLLSLRMDTDEGERKMRVLIEQDPQISAKIIGLANSAVVGSTRHILSVKEAVMLLGITRTKSVATGIAIMSLMAKAPAGKFNMRDLWVHGFGISFAMLGIARAMPGKIRPDDDQIFLAGMLHDIGYLVLAFLDPKRSDILHTRMAAEPGRVAMEIEKEMLEICHDEMGSELVRHWNLPEEIVTTLRYHHTPDEAGAAAELAYMINIAEKLLPSFGICEYVGDSVSAEEWGKLGIDPDDEEEIRDQVNEQADQAMQFASSFA